MFGLPTWAVKPLIYLVSVAAIGLALWGLHHHIDAAGYERAEREITAAYAKRDAAAAKAANDRIRVLETAARDAERRHETDLDLIATEYESKLRAKDDKTADLTRRVADGTLRLRDRDAQCPATGGGGTATALATAPGLGNGAQTSKLSEPAAGTLSVGASQFLIGLAGECDAVAEQLTAAQAVIAADRK